MGTFKDVNTCVYSRRIYRSLVSLGRYIPKYFILFIAMVNGIVSLISLSVFSLLVYRNAQGQCFFINYFLKGQCLSLLRSLDGLSKWSQLDSVVFVPSPQH